METLISELYKKIIRDTVEQKCEGVKIMKMELYQCNECESHYAVTPTIASHSCPFCNGDVELVSEGNFKED